jgi:chromosome segregation ATPase
MVHPESTMTEMATTDPASPAPKQHNPWKWVSAVLAVVSIGLLVWALSAQSDKNDLQTQLDKGKESSSTFAVSSKALYDDVSTQLGIANEDLATTEQDLADSQQAADKAAKDAEQAKKDAEQADNETDKAKAEAEQAKAEQKATESKVAVIADCAKAYFSAFGMVADGEDSAAVEDKLKGITADCKKAFADA